MDPQLVLLFFQILDRLVLLFQGFLRRKNVCSMELQGERVLPAEKRSITIFSGLIDVFGAYLSSAVFAR